MIAEGKVTAGFEAVAEAFEESFIVRGDTGAACAVYVDGTSVVDLWGGTTPRGPWRAGTRSLMFSVSKGITTVCALMAAERGLLDLDGPVSAYWPSYGEAGKDETTVRMLLAHRAGLPAPEEDFTLAALADTPRVVDALARQKPAWMPGAGFAYHALTLGWLVGEVFLRATGRTVGEWLDAEIVRPLGLQMAFGADPADDAFAPAGAALPDEDPDPARARALADALADPRVLRAITLGHAFSAVDLIGSLHSSQALALELPAANLVTDARSLARLYAATVGEVDGVRLLQAHTVEDAMRVQSEGPPELGLFEGHRWGTGFMIDSTPRPMLGPGSFGHDGAGGHLAFGHLGLQVGFAYQTGRPGGVPDDRANALARALAACLTGG